MKTLLFLVTNVVTVAVQYALDNGQWSVWLIDKTDICSKDCSRNITLIRMCNEKSATGERKCEGRSRKVITESCTGGDCVSPSADLETLTVGVVAAFVLFSGIALLYMWRRKKQHKDPVTVNKIDYGVYIDKGLQVGQRPELVSVESLSATAVKEQIFQSFDNVAVGDEVPVTEHFQRDKDKSQPTLEIPKKK